jgi:hypothetical protein
VEAPLDRQQTGLGLLVYLEMMPDGSARRRILEAVVFAQYSPEGNSTMVGSRGQKSEASSCCACESGRMQHDDDDDGIRPLFSARCTAGLFRNGKVVCVFVQLFYQRPQSSETSVGVDVS